MPEPATPEGAVMTDAYDDYDEDRDEDTAFMAWLDDKLSEADTTRKDEP